MSYILDALKKSEQERGSGHIPNVQTVHTSSLNYSNKKSYWPYVFITIVVLNLVAIIYFYLDKNKPHITKTDTNLVNDATSVQRLTPPQTSPQKSNPDKNSININQQTITTPDKLSIPAERQNLDYYAEPSDSKQLPPASAANLTDNMMTDTYRKPAVIEYDVAKNSNEEIIDFYDLPASIKRQLPSITITAHVYSDNPLQRSIVVNNDFLEEGEHILDDLILQEITKDGAIMNYQGTVFRYGVISGWQ